MILIYCLVLLISGLHTVQASEVVIYTSLDQVFSEPILQRFAKQTGIEVKPVYDVEASKTTGLVNRLIAEKNHPRADVFWNSEFGRTLLLKKKGVLASYFSPSADDIADKFKDKNGYWTGFGVRSRVLIYNTSLLKPSEVPQSIFKLTQQRWKGKVAMGYPLFGTTATHVAAWFAYLGEEKAKKYLTDLKNNNVVIVNGNSVSRDLVVSGEVPLGFTDTDDVNVAIQSGKPVDMVFPDKGGMGTLAIPNTVALVYGGPNPEQGKKLIDFLLSSTVESLLAFSGFMQIPVRAHVKKPDYVPQLSSIKTMPIDYEAIADHMQSAALFSRRLF